MTAAESLRKVLFGILIERKHSSNISGTSDVYTAVKQNEKELPVMDSNDQKYLAQKIRTQYMEKEHTQLDALKELDAKVRRPAGIFAYVFGSADAIVMGCGMSLIMTDIGFVVGMTGSTMVPGIIIGVIGMAMALINYPLYKTILNHRRARYKAAVMTLSDRIMSSQH